MTSAPDAFSLLPDPARSLPQRRSPARGKVRLLFGCKGWPSGVLEIGSWAKCEGLAEVVIFQLQPGYEAEAFRSAIRAFAQRKGLAARFLAEDGSLNAATRDALMSVGGQFIRRLIELDPHVVGFRTEGGCLEEVKGYVRAVRLFSDAEIVLGGPTAPSHPREVLEDCGADYVFAGEAEEPFNQFLRLAWERNSADRQPEIPGLAYRYGGCVWHNTLPHDGYGRSLLDVDGSICGTSRRCLQHLVRPVAAAGLIAACRLDWSLCEGFARQLDSLFFTGGRGCPGACTFCAKLHGQEVRVKSAPQLLEEIEAADALVAAGKLKLGRWDLFKHVVDPALKARRVAWASIFDEDFLLHRKRAVEFFRLWNRSPLKDRYRISIQTNPCTLLAADGRVHEELLHWIDRLKPMVQLGAESFNPELLARWHKRHTVGQLNTVLDALDTTRQDYSVFQLLTDFDTTPEELVETLRLLVLGACRRRRMRIASSPFTIPLYDSDTRKSLEYSSPWNPARVRHFTEYESPQPGWMDPLAAELADLADQQLHWALELQEREGALAAVFENVLERIIREEARLRQDSSSVDPANLRIRRLRRQAEEAMEQIKEVRFQGLGFY